MNNSRQFDDPHTVEIPSGERKLLLSHAPSLRSKAMKASQNLPGVRLDAACRHDGPAAASAAGLPNLVVENLAEFAAAGVPALCQICWADCAALPVTRHDGHRSSPWILRTAR
jgi:hypothetical protein